MRNDSVEQAIAMFSDHERYRRADDRLQSPNSVDRLRSRLYIGAAVCDLPPLEALVEGVLFKPGESVLYSPPKLAKTFFELDLHLSVATGRDFMGHPVKQGNTTFVAAEGVGGLGARVAAWREHHGVEDIDAAAFLATAVNLTDLGAVAELCDIIRERQAVLVGIDTLHRCSVGADENFARDMGPIIENIDMIRDVAGHVQLVHHTGKDTSKGMRGSNSLLGAVDTTIELTGDSHTITVAVRDQKDAEPCPPWHCQLVPVGDSAVIVPTDGEAMVTAAQTTVLEALESLPVEDRTATKWEEMAAEAGVARRTFFRVKKALQTRGRVEGGGGRGAAYRLVAEDDSEPF
jgi:AAA domain